MSVNMSCEYGEGGAWQLVKDGDVDGARQWLTANLHIRPYCGARCPLAPAGTRATAPAPPERPNGRNSADRRPSGSSGCGSAVPCQTSPEKVAAIRAAWLRVAEAAAADVASGDADAIRKLGHAIFDDGNHGLNSIVVCQFADIGILVFKQLGVEWEHSR